MQDQSAVERAILEHSLPLERPGVDYTYDNTIVLKNGNKVFDASCGAGVSCLGHHKHPKIERAKSQALGYITARSFSTKYFDELADVFKDVTDNKLRLAHVCSSGSDAVEAAMKMATTCRPGGRYFIARKQSYHGATGIALAIGDHKQRKAPYINILPDNAHHISACYTYRDHQDGQSIESYIEEKEKELEDKVEELGASNVIAFVLEPVAGATIGCVPAPPGYLHAMATICRKHGILFICDEIMCGLGRTGKMSVSLGERVIPDLLIVGKGLGAGYEPVAAVLSTPDILNDLGSSFVHGYTYQDHSTGCAVATVVVKIIRGLLPNIQKQGKYLETLLHRELGSHPYVGDIRGVGLFWAIEFVQNKETKTPFDPRFQVSRRLYWEAMIDSGIHIYYSEGTVDGIKGDHVMIAPPYNCSGGDVRFVVSRLSLAVQSLFQTPIKARL